MRLTIIDKDDQRYTMVEIITLEWDGKSNGFTVFSSDSDYAEIRLSTPWAVQNIINSLKTLGNAESDGEIVWRGVELDEGEENESDDVGCNSCSVIDEESKDLTVPNDDSKNHGWIAWTLIFVFLLVICLYIPDIKNKLQTNQSTQNSDSIIGELLPDDTPLFRIIHRDGRTSVAYNTVNNVMYTLICDGYGRIKQSEIMLNPDGSPMVWDEEAKAPVGYEALDFIEATTEETNTYGECLEVNG